MYNKCNKKCNCITCEHYAGKEISLIENEDLKYYNYPNNHSKIIMHQCNNGLRVGLKAEDLKTGYEVENYYIKNNELLIRNY